METDRCLSIMCMITLIVSGCGSAATQEQAAREFYAAPPRAGQADIVLAQAPAAKGDGDVDAIPVADNAPNIRRQIIYAAELWLVVEQFEGVAEKVAALVEQHGAFVAHSQVQGQSGSPRSATWKVRVPQQEYENFVKACRGVGEVQRLAVDSQDVSEEFYDLEARIRNKEIEEKRLLKHLEETTAKLDEILAVERELSRVREELERMQGRMRVLKDLVALTTVTLHVDEVKGFVPAEAPTLMTRLSRAFGGSLEAMQEFGEGLLVLSVAVLPWLALLAVPVAVVVVRLRRRARAA